MSLPFTDVDSIQGPLEMTYEEFKREETVASFEHFAYQCWLIHEAGPPNELFFILKELLEKYPQLSVDAPDLFARYQEIASLLMAASLAVRPEPEVREFFTKWLVSTLRLRNRLPDGDIIDLRENIHFRLRFTGLLFVSPEDDQRFMAQAMQNNTEKIGSQPISTQTGTAAPIVGNWVKDYDQFFPSFTVRSGLERLRYINEGTNPRKLSADDRKLLIHVLEIYDCVRFPALAWKEMGRETPPRTPRGVAKRVAVLSSQALLSRAEEELAAALQRVAAESQGNLPKVLRMFYDNLFPVPGVRYDRAYVLGSLAMLAREGWILRMISEANPVREAFTKYLREEGKPEEAQTFALSPTSPLSLGKFLRFVLQRRMRMSESDAAQIAVRVGNILKQAGKPEYFDMAYFDQSTGTFKWK